MRATLTMKLGLMLLLPLVGMLLGTGFMVTEIRRTEADSRFMNVAERQRMLATEMRAWVQMVAAGQDEDREGLRQRIVEFDTALVALEQGGFIMDGRVVPAPEELQPRLGALAGQWSATKPDLDALAGAGRTGAPFQEAAARIDDQLAELTSRSNALVAAADARTQRLNHQAINFLRAFGGAMFLVFLATILLTRRYVVRPILRAARAAERISGGDLSQRLETSSGDELATLAEALNDVTAQLKAQIGTLHMLSASVEQSADSVLVTNAAGVILFVNPAFEATTGYTLREAAGQTPSILKSGKQDSEFYRNMWSTILAGGVFRGVLVNRRRDGTLYHAEATISPLRIDGDAITHFVSAEKDVTARIAAEDRLRLVLSNIPVGFFTLEARPPWTATFVSNAVHTLFGYEPADFLGDPHLWQSLVHDADAPKAAAVMGHLMEHGHAVREYRFRDARGQWRWIQEGTRLVRSEDGSPREVVGYWADITELMDVRETLRDSEERYQGLFNHASDGILVSDASARNVDANEAGLSMLGYSREEFCGMGISDLFPAEDLPANPIRMDELAQGKSLVSECRLRRKDGTLVHVEISARQMPDGRLVSIARDLSERHRAEQELRDMEARLIQAQKMEAIGRLAGGVAHDFNNLLAVILSYAGFVAEELEDSDPLRAHIEEVLKAGRRAAVLTRQLLAFGRKSVVQPQVLSLNLLIEDMEGMLTRTIGEQVRLSIHLQPSLWNIKADPSQVEQILVNLVVNARDAMPAGGRLEVETANQEVTEALASRHPGLHAGNYVTLIVSDDGIGMTPEVLARVFEPFFTTKEKGKGTGLGLATVFGAVKQANGYVQVDSEPGKGARFIIYLPMTADSARQPQLAPDDLSLRGGAETVLVVEDEDAVRALTVRILTRNGFRVLEAANAGEALLECERSNPPVDVVLTDVVMPRMSGPEMLERLQERWPMLRAVYMSGYANDGRGPGGVLEPALPFVPKPFTEEQLVKTINAVCGR